MSNARSSTVVSGSAGGTGEPCVVPPSERAEIRLRDEAAVSLYAVRHAPVSDHRSAAGLADVAAQVGKTFLAAEHQVAGHAGETPDLASGAVLRVEPEHWGKTRAVVPSERRSPVPEGYGETGNRAAHERAADAKQ